MKLEFCQQIFQKYSNIKFHEYPSSGILVVANVDIRTDRHEDANSRFSKFCETA